jgi:long-chain acyl-CoA synthetase
VVTIYTNLGEDGVQHGIAQTEAGTVVVGQELVPRLLAVLPSVPSVTNVIVIANHKTEPLPENTERVTFHKFSTILTLGANSSVHASPPDATDTAIIMYTSGSTGVPKGVVMTHANLVQALFSLIPTIGNAVGDRDDDCYIAVLPLAHVLELLAENVMMVFGIPIGYSNTKTFTDAGTMVAKGSKVSWYSRRTRALLTPTAG